LDEFKSCFHEFLQISSTAKFSFFHQASLPVARKVSEFFSVNLFLQICLR